uniref:CSON009308 protein n=1 Tax=Culicoides sonorensis TaxID=179676 RepID=A0A336N8X3_CULSO
MDEYHQMVERGECDLKAINPPPEPEVKLPEAKFKKINDYNICDAPPRPNAYIRYIEKSPEELDGEVEYDVDEEDTTWLSIINEQRQESDLAPVGVDQLELLMDRLEKESYFQAAANGQSGAVVDDDAVCCICMDGECQNTNVILFCDMCNLAVHQDCYGVPYIPEGQWLCRRCLQSPSRPVDCVLCPNSGGAFKQTDTGGWAHVVCALWIPEVRFANTVFLEPIDSIEMIPQARWRLVCYICKQKGIGACIQCNRNSCYAAFHVTCAQQAGLCMRMDTVKGNEAHPIIVQKTAFCDAHTPSDANENETPNPEKLEESRVKMKKARKLLAKKRQSVPVILIPTIPPERIQEISHLVSIQKKSQFIQRLVAYWMLKRQYRNGVPLLRRLQTQSQTHGRSGLDGSPDAKELYQQLKYWQCLRQDLERARLLCELVRKREKLKLALIRTKEQCVMLEINPLEISLDRILDQLEAKDSTEIFLEPVDTMEVADYLDVIKNPMDLGTMRKKLKQGDYSTLEELEDDFDLMIRNCLTYNNKETVFYRAGIRMRDAGGIIFRAARRELERAGLIEPGKSEDAIAAAIDNEIRDILKGKPSADAIKKLEGLLTKVNSLKTGQAKQKRIKIIKADIAKMKKQLGKEAVKDDNNSDVEKLDTSTNSLLTTPINSPNKSNLNNSASPSGVNRRTAVLFTRKAQNQQINNKKIEPLVKTDFKMNTATTVIEKPKSPGRKGGRRRGTSKKGSEPDYDKARLGLGSTKNLPDSFRVYRGQTDIAIPSDSDDSMNISGSETCSSCSDFTGSDSEYGSSFDDDRSGSEMVSSDNEEEVNTVSSNNKDDELELEALKLVWAKCRGYPWYPALIIDPTVTKDFLHNGVPLPAPPSEVMALRKNFQEPVFLVLFFDVKRTWQWLPPNKLELLGIEKELDQAKLMESRKPTERKAVKKAYQEALHYQSQVSSSGPPVGKL